MSDNILWQRITRPNVNQVLQILEFEYVSKIRDMANKAGVTDPEVIMALENKARDKAAKDAREWSTSGMFSTTNRQWRRKVTAEELENQGKAKLLFE